MTTYNTGNLIGSTDARDRSDNSENMDILENSTTLNAHPDRLGTMRKTRKGMELEHDNQISAHEVEHDNQMLSFENDFNSRLAGMAFTRVGTFTTGATLTDMRQTLLWEVSQGGDGREYGWTGSFSPAGKVVAAGSTPLTTGGVSAGAWIDRTDVTLRGDIEASVFESLRRSYADAGFTLVGGSFESGGTLNNTNDVLVHKASGIAYSWGGTLPKFVSAGSTPSTSGGIGPVAWINRGDPTLRADLYSSSGSSLVGFSATETVKGVIDKLQAAPVATGAENSIVINHATTHTSYSTKYIYRFIALLTNTGSTTINIDGLGAKALLGSAKIACQGGEVAASGYCEAVYDASIDSVVLLSCTGGNKQVKSGLQPNHAVSFGQLPITATESTAGIVRKATDSEEIAGSSDVGFLTPLGLRNALRAAGSAPVFAPRAWVNFNGVGTPTIAAGGNVSSITDIGTGVFEINFTEAMSDSLYGVTSAIGDTSGGSIDVVVAMNSVTTTPVNKTVSTVRVVSRGASYTYDIAFISLTIMR